MINQTTYILPIHPEPSSNAANFILTPARIPASTAITTPRRQLPPIPVEQCQNISMPNELSNEFDLNLSALSPFSSLHPRREHVSLGNLNFQKLSSTRHSEPMEIDIPKTVKSVEEPCSTACHPTEMANPSLVSVQQPSEPIIPAIDSQIQPDTPSNTTTTEQLLEIIYEPSGTPQLLENAASPPSPQAYLDDMEDAPAEAEEATDVAPPQAISPSAQQALVGPTSSENADFPTQSVENGTPSHSSAILSHTTAAAESVNLPQHPEETEDNTSPSGDESHTYTQVKPNIPECAIHPHLCGNNEQVVWANWKYNALKEKVDSIYEEIVTMRRNMFKVPSGKAGKDLVNEMAFWIKQFNQQTKLNGVALKTLMILPTLLLQKPSRNSKAKQHLASLQRRMESWKNGNLEELLKETRHIQSGFKSSRGTNGNSESLSKRFSKFMSEGKVSAALKLLDQSSSSGLLPLTEEVMSQLEEKHPPPAPIVSDRSGDPLLRGPIDNVPDCFFDSIDEQMILKAAKDTKGAGGPSGLDADQYRRIICSKNFNREGKMLREELAEFAKNIATKHYNPSLIEAYTSCRLIPLDKDPGIRPIGIGEVLRRIIGKSISRSVSQCIMEAAGPLQTCAGHGAGAEAAIHAMRQIFQSDETDAVLLIDASNAFNRLNRQVALHNIQVTCPVIATYVINTYRQHSILYVAGGKKMLSREGTTQGDPLAMAWYSLSTTVLIDSLRAKFSEVKQVWLADDASAAGKIEKLKKWYDELIKEGEKFGYHVNGSKSWLIVKDDVTEQEAKKEFGDSVNITTEGQRHLGAVIGSTDFKKMYCMEKVTKWREELMALSQIAETHPQMAYAAYTKGYASKFTYFMRTIEGFGDYLAPVDEVLNSHLIPALFGMDSELSYLREVIGLKSSDGGLNIPILESASNQQFESSMKITSPHVASIQSQENRMLEKNLDGQTKEDLAKMNRIQKSEQNKVKMKEVDDALPATTKAFVDQARDKGASSWLNALPIEELSFVLNKEEFRDALRLRYNMKLDNLPSVCACGESFNVNHALSCKKGGFVHQRHDTVKNTLTKLLSRVCKDVEEEPHLIPVTNEQFERRSANTADEARLDIKAKGFWQRGQTAFFDVRVTHLNTSTQRGQTTSKIFRAHEMAKRREYLQRVLDVENGSFTPLVFGTNGGLGEECASFLSTLSQKIASKDDESYAHTVTWIRTRLSFDILKAAIQCVRGSRTPFRRPQELNDFEMMSRQGDLARV